MHSLGSISAIASEKKIFLYFPDMVLRWQPSWISDRDKKQRTFQWSLLSSLVSEKKRFETFFQPNCTWMFIGWSSTNFTFFVLIWNSKWRLRQDLFNIGPFGKNVSKRFFSETKLLRSDHWKVLCFLSRSEIQDGCHRRTISGKYRNIFFSEVSQKVQC
jgi:hypothetical protein